MDSNSKKQQQNYARPKACQSTDSSNRKSSSSTDLQLNKSWPRNSRRREQPAATRNDQQRNSKQHPSTKTRPNVDKRPRPRGGGFGNGGANNANNIYDGPACAPDDISAAGTGLAAGDLAYGANGAVAKEVYQLDYELNSVYAPGSKKQNLNHLLNFHYAPRESDYSAGLNVFGRNGGGGAGNHMHRHGGSGKKHKYNKEQFLQANFQFVIKSSAKPRLNASPDALIDWNLIEQINIQTTEEPQCPICLYPPIAAKLTRCGHAYCWPCILHYLALSDKTWRKCPICYEAIHTADLKSTTIVQQRPINAGAEITFQLMRRKKGSMFIEKFQSDGSSVERYPSVSQDDEAKLFSKFLIAKRGDILDIIERERRELISGEDASCPEFVFIQQALDLLKERREKLGEMTIKEEEEEEKPTVAAAEEPMKLELNVANKELEEEITNIDESEVTDRVTTPSVTEAEQATAAKLSGTSCTAKYYYFYQSQDGQNIYLHPLNVKMLQACYGTLERAPLLINARILQKEHHSMDEEHRRKFTCLGHLPLTCQFAVVEVDLQPPIVADAILKLFKDDILFRKKERQRRDREERKREKHINEINDRQMGKLIASTANLNLNSSHEFPSCGFDDFLLGATTEPDHTFDAPPLATPAIATPKRHATYSAVAVEGESPQIGEFWPTLASPAASSLNGYQEMSVWGKSINSVATKRPQRAASDRSSECESLNEMSAAALDLDAPPSASSMRTELGDVLAMAISQKKQQATPATAGKKNKKAKKMLPLFSTGINYNGN